MKTLYHMLANGARQGLPSWEVAAGQRQTPSERYTGPYLIDLLMLLLSLEKQSVRAKHYISNPDEE